MRTLKALPFFVVAFTAAAWAQTAGNNTNTGSTYIPGTTFQKENPNYPIPNPFYFEGKIDYEKLGITTPANAWEFLQRGMHYQDDLMDIPDAMSDYQSALALNSLTAGTCQLVTTVQVVVNAAAPTVLNPMPCMFTIRLRLAYLLRQSNPAQAVELYGEVLQIDPLRLEVNTMMAEAYVFMAQQATTTGAAMTAYQNAIAAYKAELVLSPVSAAYTALTGDTANNSKVHWELAAVYQTLGQNANAIGELQLYLQATQWHSDVYPWRIPLAQSMINQLQTHLKAPSNSNVNRDKREPRP
jgi:tetratricopeptide (TPR) repeat protein